MLLAPQLSVTECEVLLTPVPLTETEFGELVALLVIVTFPITLPVALGAKTTFNSEVCPAAIVVPRIPLSTLNPVPVTAICEIVRLEFPVFLTATPRGIDPPTTSFPKFKLDVESEMVRVALPPVPLRAMVYVGFEALLLIVTLPVTLPDAVGPNATVKLFVCEAANVRGTAMPLIVNPVPLTAALEIVKLEPPVFFN